LGSGDKRVAPNELETVVVQRRCIRAARDLPAGIVLTRELLTVLRPAPIEAIQPYEMERVLGRRVQVDVPSGKALEWTFLGD
jgi:sialic acid synthase SpsE